MNLWITELVSRSGVPVVPSARWVMHVCDCLELEVGRCVFPAVAAGDLIHITRLSNFISNTASNCWITLSESYHGPNSTVVAFHSNYFRLVSVCVWTAIVLFSPKKIRERYESKCEHMCPELRLFREVLFTLDLLPRTFNTGAYFWLFSENITTRAVSPSDTLAYDPKYCSVPLCLWRTEVT